MSYGQFLTLMNQFHKERAWSFDASGSEKTGSLVAVGKWLLHEGYAFVTPTPATHARVLARSPGRIASNMRDVFGWSLPFSTGLLPSHCMAWLRDGGLVEESGGIARSLVRYSSIAGMLFAHSAYPTSAADAVFFGPDTYRFVSLIQNELALRPLSRHMARVLDVGCGAGPGGLAAAMACTPLPLSLHMADINDGALVFAKANAELTGVPLAALAQGDLYDAVEGNFDFIVSNPPYLNDLAGRLYRHGGGPWGGGLSERIVREGLPRLAPGGRLVLYTGAAMIEGADPLLDALRPQLDHTGWPWSYRELDPDVFGEELQEPAYANADRIAAVALIVHRPAA